MSVRASVLVQISGHDAGISRHASGVFSEDLARVRCDDLRGVEVDFRATQRVSTPFPVVELVESDMSADGVIDAR